jgi:hypothetical protein
VLGPLGASAARRMLEQDLEDVEAVAARRGHPA